MQPMTRGIFLLAALCAAFATAGCGGSSPSSQATPLAAASAMPVATTESQRETAALPLAQAAPIPSDLKCSGAVVWANEKRKTYHLSADPYYGRTKHGKYMCKEAADAAGYHVAGTKRSHKHGVKSTPDATATTGNTQ